MVDSVVAGTFFDFSLSRQIDGDEPRQLVPRVKKTIPMR
jgi:hypothetical protein